MKINKDLVLGITLGGLIFGGVGVYAATTLSATSVTYTPGDTSWNVTNANEALDDLYSLTQKLTSIDFSYTTLVSTVNQSGGTANSNTATLSYTIKSDDITNNYKFYIMTATVSGISGASWGIIDSINVPSNAIKLHKYPANMTIPGYSYKVDADSCTYLIPANDVGTVMSVSLRGVYTFSVVGVK